MKKKILVDIEVIEAQSNSYCNHNHCIYTNRGAYYKTGAYCRLFGKNLKRDNFGYIRTSQCKASETQK